MDLTPLVSQPIHPPTRVTKDNALGAKNVVEYIEYGRQLVVVFHIDVEVLGTRGGQSEPVLLPPNPPLSPETRGGGGPMGGGGGILGPGPAAPPGVGHVQM